VSLTISGAAPRQGGDSGTKNTRCEREPWHSGAVPRGAPLESPTFRPYRGERPGSPPPRARWTAAPQYRRAVGAGHAAAPGNPTCGGPTVGAAARRTARAPGGGPGGRPGSRPQASSAALPTDRSSGAACGPRSWSRLPALLSLAATPRCQGFRSALDTAGTPTAVTSAAGEATVAPDGRAGGGLAGSPGTARRCGLRAAIVGGLARVHHR